MNMINDEKNRLIIEELTATKRLLTDLTEAGSWVINFEPDGSVASVQWGDGLRRLLGYSDLIDFPNELESFIRGIHQEDRDAFIGGISASIYDENIMRTAGYDFRFFKRDGSVVVPQQGDAEPGSRRQTITVQGRDDRCDPDKGT